MVQGCPLIQMVQSHKSKTQMEGRKGEDTCKNENECIKTNQIIPILNGLQKSKQNVQISDVFGLLFWSSNQMATE